MVSGGGDPFLSGELAYETILGIQSQGVQACAKHYINKCVCRLRTYSFALTVFVPSEQEHFRETSSSNVDDRLISLYLTFVEFSLMLFPGRNMNYMDTP